MKLPRPRRPRLTAPSPEPALRPGQIPGSVARRVLRKLIGPIYAPSYIYAVGTGALAPMIVLAALALGFSQSHASAVAGVSGLVAVVSSPIVGSVIARRSEKNSMITASLIACVALVGMFVALWNAGQVWAKVVYVAGLAVLAVAQNVYSLARQSYVAQSVPPVFRPRALSTYGGMIRLGNLTGPALGSAVVGLWTLGAVFVLHIATALIAMLLIILFTLPQPRTLVPTPGSSKIREDGAPASGTPSLAAKPLADKDEAGNASGASGSDAAGLEETDPTPATPATGATSASAPSSAPSSRPDWMPAPRSSVDVPASVVVGLGITCLSLVRANRNVLIPLWGAALGLDAATISLVWAVAAVIDVSLFYPSGVVMERYGRLAVLAPTLGLMGLAFVALPFTSSPLTFVVGACLVSLGGGLGAGILMTTGADLAPDDQKVKFLGYWNGVGNLGSMLGPFLAAWLTAQFSLAVAIRVTGVIAVVAAAWVVATLPWAYARLGMNTRGLALSASDSRGRSRRLRR